MVKRESGSSKSSRLAMKSRTGLKKLKNLEANAKAATEKLNKAYTITQ
jgi:hypothetical protein